MHKYLKAVGFSSIKKNADLNILLLEVIKNYDSKKITETTEGRLFAEFTKEFAPDIGICICGEYNEKNDFNIENHFPYVAGSRISFSEEVVVEKRADNESYIGACDDIRLEISLIFHLINTADYLNFCEKKLPQNKTSPVLLSALSVEGKILLPILKTEESVKQRQKLLQKRSALIMAARGGDETAMESLAESDMNIYNEISNRVNHEDVYSIIDNCFMPYGYGSDMYSVIGDIQEVKTLQNCFTGENLIKMSLSCNDINLDVCINEKDLLGEPAAGRRFKGVIWLQGRVEF